jgi:hypothetical protein
LALAQQITNRTDDLDRGKDNTACYCGEPKVGVSKFSHQPLLFGWWLQLPGAVR